MVGALTTSQSQVSPPSVVVGGLDRPQPLCFGRGAAVLQQVLDTSVSTWYCKSMSAENESLRDIVGKTVTAVDTGTAEGAWGDEPATVLHFADGSTWSFVHPQDAD